MLLIRAGNRFVILTIIFGSMIYFCPAFNAVAVAVVKTDQDVYSEGQKIRVNFVNAPGSNRDWICIVAAGSSDDDAGDYQYLPYGVSQGELTFDAPPPGKYEVRAYYNYSRNGYVVTSRYSFTVVDKAAAAKPPAAVPEKIKPVESPPVKTSSSTTQQFNVAVFYFTPLNVDATHYGLAVTNALINAPNMQSSFTMLSRKDLELFLSANNLQQDEQLDNIMEIGTRLSLNFVVAGNVEKKGTRIVANCKVVNIGQRKIVFATEFVATGEADLISTVMKMSSSIIEAIKRSN